MIHKLDNFEGPLDLLLHLIDKNQIDIYDIPISELADQYIGYVENFLSEMDSMSEFVMLAATLLEIKSKMLLPKPVEKETDTIDPREELVEKLIEYKRFRLISEELRDSEASAGQLLFRQADSAVISRLKARNNFSNIMNEVSLDKLFFLFEDILLRKEPKSENIPNINTLDKEAFSIEDKISSITNLLYVHREISFWDLLGSCNYKPEKIVIFLAVLELCKMNVLSISQDVYSGEYLLSLKTEEDKSEHGYK